MYKPLSEVFPKKKKRPIDTNVEALFTYLVEHSRLEYPGIYRCNFVFRDLQDIKNHVFSRRRKGAHRLDITSLEVKRKHIELYSKSIKGSLLWRLFLQKQYGMKLLPLVDFIIKPLLKVRSFLINPFGERCKTDYVHLRKKPRLNM